MMTDFIERAECALETGYRAGDILRDVIEKVAELDCEAGKKINKSHWDGYHPSVYGKVNKNLADKFTKELCLRLQKDDVSKYSLEMQIN